jgi:hypothetical protein
MKHLLYISFLFLSVFVSGQTRYDVSSIAGFNSAQDQASEGDSIVWEAGTYYDTSMEIYKDGLIVTAEPYGSVLFTGVSRVIINADDVTFSGFQYIGGYIGTLDVIRNYGSDVLITHVNIQNYTSYKYLVVYESSKRTTISYCNFENRLNLDDKNILSILVDDEPGYHRIQYCSFKNFDGTGNDLGIEPIRIGLSSQGHLDSRTLVEYCYFTQCNGDGEIISHKSRQNVYRYNTFENNPEAELVLRHGDEGIVYGNFFLNNMGGIRIREGSDHFIYNNYFEALDRRAIYLQNDPSDPLSNIHIYHNTIINSEEIRLGSNGSNPPTNVVIANNIFTDPQDKLFDEATGNETWIGNFSFGDLGIDPPSSGLSNTDPGLFENTEGYFQPDEGSPAIAAAGGGYPLIPLYPGMDYDNEIMFDLMNVSRPVAIPDRAIGASEFSSTVEVQPHANEMNTGPTYLFDNLVNYLAVNSSLLYYGNEEESKSVFISSNLDWTVTSSSNWITTDLSSGSGDAELNITLNSNEETAERSGVVTITGDSISATIEVNQDAGGPVGVDILEVPESQVLIFPNPTDGRIILGGLEPETSALLIDLFHLDGRSISSKRYQIIDNELAIKVDKLTPGVYVMKIRFMGADGTINDEVIRKFVRE